MIAEGHNGQVALDGAWLVITRSGIKARASHGAGEKRIPVAQITAVQFKDAGTLANGYIQFTIPGSRESTGRTMDAAKDENSVLFTKRQAGAFRALRDALNEQIAARYA